MTAPSGSLTWQLPVLALVVVVGIGAGLSPTLAVAVVVGIAVMATMASSVTAGLMVFAVVAFLESLPAVGGTASSAKLFGIFLALGWLGAVTLGRLEGGSRSLFASNPLLVTTLVLYLTWAAFSLLWAESTAVAQETVIRYALNFLLFPIVFAALRRPRHVVWLYAVFVAGALLSVLIGLRSTGSEFTGRLGGSGVNPNQIGALLAVAAILAMTLFAVRTLHTRARLLALASGILCVVAVVATVSRGAMLGLAAGTLAAPLLVGRTRRLRALGFMAIVAVVVVAWAGAFASARTIDRLTGSYESGSGRTALWTIAGRMIDDKPVTGVGAGNFPVSSIHYLLEPGTTIRDEYIIDTPKATHNIYLQVGAELGLVGLTLFLSLLAGSIACAVRAARTFARNGLTSEEMLARGLVIALIALLTADIFSTEIYSKQLYLLLAVGPALLAMSRRAAPTRS